MNISRTNPRRSLKAGLPGKIRTSLCLTVVAGILVGLHCDKPTPTWAQETPPSPVPRFTVTTTPNNRSGSVSLQWTFPNVAPSRRYRFEVQQSFQKDFSSPQSIYSGPDRGTYLSGLPNGDYFFRVRLLPLDGTGVGQWSPVVHRSVQHPSLRFSSMMLGVGATVFLCTTGIIIHGARKEPGE
ncbi:MAG: fibronectin type III domain-containing protein [Nitrospira sp.]|nr:fibronectin type III domain-containing protein [Nitrospira sp.]